MNPLKNISSFWERWITRLLIVVIISFALFMLSFLFTSCNSSKRAARQDDKAVNRVNSSEPLQSRVISKWLDAHPPIEGKPEIKYLPGTVQIKEIPVTDYKTLQRIKDSLIKALGDTCQDYSISAYEAGFDQAEKYYKENPFIRTDTIQKTIPDLREANRWRDSSNYWKGYANYVSGISAQKTEQLQQLKKDLTGKNWLIILLFILLGLSVALNIKAVITKIKLPKL